MSTEGQIEVDGMRLTYSQAGQGDPVVVLDSGSSDLTALREELAFRNEIITLGLPGSGSSVENSASLSAREMAATVSRALAQIAPEHYTLIGTSFGADVALWLALQNPDPVEALVLVSPTLLLPSGGTHDPEAERRLGEIQCSTLVVFGSRDQVISPQAASIFRGNIPNCNVSLVYDAGHEILAERPEALLGVVRDYIDRRETFVVSYRSSIINP